MKPGTLALTLTLAALGGCVSDAADLGASGQPLSVWQWFDDVRIPDKSSGYQVGLAPFGTDLFMIYAQSSNGQLTTSRYDGRGWSGTRWTDMYAEYGPALTRHGNQLVSIYHARGQNRLMMSTSTDGMTWSRPVTAGTSLVRDQLRYAPAVVVHGGELYVGYCRRTSAGDRLRVDRFDGTTWTESASYNVPFECKHVAMGGFPDGRLDLVVTSESVDLLRSFWFLQEFAGSGRPSPSWPGVTNSMRSAKPPSIVTCGGVTHLVHGGSSTPREIWWSFFDRGGWVPDVRVPDQASDGGAALGCLQGNRTIMVHNGGTTQLWASEFGP